MFENLPRSAQCDLFWVRLKAIVKAKGGDIEQKFSSFLAERRSQFKLFCHLAYGFPNYPATSKSSKQVFFQCRDCGKFYKYERNLQSHLKNECFFYCGYDPLGKLAAIQRKDQFTLNTVVNENASFKCKKCSKTYKYQSSLYNHVTYECGNPPKFQCPVCPYKAHRKGNLAFHIKNRHPEFAMFSVQEMGI
ncbi:gastrula zinc finger protein XlCGF7.1-like [Ctenocephalides felis]|uniref:gastrula zinc finger protein XlCGF7.1-like n=1 Tax=Ctenocephalides felis TaxID=7515 RepID=UPI000E6E3A95|nr:gastrula zinc finger protein XlCGF7.1-like [Ctenocephalides felis]